MQARRFGVLSLLLSISLLAISQSDHTFDTVEVSSFQLPLRAVETGRNITVINAKQIQSMAATSVDEVLQLVAGVELQSRGGFGVQGDILLRGSTYTQVLVLVDGMKLNDPLTAHFNGYMPVSPAEIERIEILRGAASAIYGADAVGGVINIVTKTFANTAEGQQISGSMNYGQHQLVNGNMGFSQRKGKLVLGGGFSQNQSMGEAISEKYIDTNTTLTAFNNFFNLKTLGFSCGYNFGQGISIQMRTAYDYRNFGARYFYTTSPFDKATETVSNWWNQMQISKTIGSSITKLNIAYKYNTDEFVYSPDFPSTNNHTSQLLNVNLTHLWSTGEHFTFQTGVQADQRKVESNDRGNHQDAHFGAYAMGVYKLKRLNVTTSLRGDYDENYQFEFSPQANVSYVFNALVFRGSMGKSIRAADYTERYVSNNLLNLTPGRSLGNPDLIAEKGWSEEIGCDVSIIKNIWQIKSTVFARQSNNLIDYVLTNQTEIGSVSEVGSLKPNADYYFAKNITDVTTSGFELESVLKYRITNKMNLIWNAGATFIKTGNENDVVSVYISSHAKKLINTNIIFQNIGKFSLSFGGLYKERNEVIATGINTKLEKDYVVFHSRLYIQLVDQFGLNFQVQNLFNTEYYNFLGAKMPGRWLMGGFKWTI